MNTRLSSDYISLKLNFLFFIVVISTMFVSLSEKSDSYTHSNSQSETSISKTFPRESFFSDCSFNLSDALPVHHILDSDKNPLSSKKSFSYIRFHGNARPDIIYKSVCNSLHLNQFRSTVLLI